MLWGWKITDGRSAEAACASGDGDGAQCYKNNHAVPQRQGEDRLRFLEFWPVRPADGFEIESACPSERGRSSSGMILGQRKIFLDTKTDWDRVVPGRLAGVMPRCFFPAWVSCPWSLPCRDQTTAILCEGIEQSKITSEPKALRAEDAFKTVANRCRWHELLGKRIEV